MAMPMIVFAFGLNGIGIKKTFLRGTDERYPMTTVSFLFFRAVLLGQKAGQLHLQAMFGLANNQEWLIENYQKITKHLKEQREKAWNDAEQGVAQKLKSYQDAASRCEEKASKAEAENYALRKVIKICSE